MRVTIRFRADQSKPSVSPEVTVVQSEWFNLQVTTDRFSLESRDPRKFLPLRDLAAATFGILEHTPIRAFGFNSHQSFQLESTEAWHKFGHHFAPKKSWSSILDQPGLLNLTIQGMRSGCSAERIQITIQPVASIENGLAISLNEHYAVKEFDDDEEPSSADVLVDALEQGWVAFHEYSNAACEHVLKEGTLPE